MIKIKRKVLLCLISLLVIVPSLKLNYSIDSKSIETNSQTRIVVNGETVENSEIIDFTNDEPLQVTLRLKELQNLNSEKSRKEIFDFYSNENQLAIKDLSLPSKIHLFQFTI
ncbi:MAG: hypothetical protein FWF56_06595 [Firmicutes bacterium]|nr:hypothetical protein [Bacillota bacterium]